jgi:Gas vesicle protein
MTVQPIQPRRSPDSLADVLERVLDKGIVIVGDIVVNVLDIELLSIKLRLFISSAQTAKEMGMDWWSRDPFFTTGDREAIDADHGAELESLRERMRELEGQVRESSRTESR